MANWYCGIGGDPAGAGTTWATRVDDITALTAECYIRAIKLDLRVYMITVFFVSFALFLFVFPLLIFLGNPIALISFRPFDTIVIGFLISLFLCILALEGILEHDLKLGQRFLFNYLRSILQLIE